MQLIKLIRETRYLDRMGFNIPEIALNVTLQEEKYYSCTDGLANMLEQYYQVTAALLLQAHPEHVLHVAGCVIVQL